MNNMIWPTQVAFESDILKLLFSGLMERGLRFAVLRNYENLPESLGGRDIDILVHPEDMKDAICAITKIVNRIGASIAKLYFDDMIVQFVLAKRLDAFKVLQIKIDLLHNRQIFGIEFLSAEEMLTNLRYHNKIPVVSEQVLLLDKLSFHLLLGFPLDIKYDAVFSEIARSNRVSLIQSLERFLTRERALALVGALEESKGSTLVLESGERWLGLARLWAAQGFSAFFRSLRFAGFRVRDLFMPKGVFLSVSGPDGSGKTTVIKMVISQLRDIYGDNVVNYAHFRPAVLPRIAEVAKKARAVETVDENYDIPHRAKPSGFLGSASRLVYYLLDYLVGYAKSLLPLLKRREVILFDRYYFDMICDPERSRIALPFSLMRFAGCLIPLPEYAFFINVDAVKIRRRKQELPLEKIYELNKRYLRLVNYGMLQRIDNNCDPEHAASKIVDSILVGQNFKARRILGLRN